MAQYQKEAPKSPTDSDATLEAVLDMVIFQTRDGDKLVRYQNQSDVIVLTFTGD